MSTALGYYLDAEARKIAQQMRLRRPQRESLHMVHELVKEMPAPLATLSAAEVVRAINELHPDWQFAERHASLTFALATGVGKTRLMGALMAYLFRTKQSHNFVLLAPRDAILRKLVDECRESSPKYIFADPSVVPQPRLCHRGNLLVFDPSDVPGLFPAGPNVFVLSPQLLVAEGRVRQPSPMTGTSVLEYLQSCTDLVVLVDESHHIGSGDADEESRSWGSAVAALGPKLVFSMTATPRPDAVVAYEYGLERCLRERLYTKAVRLIVDDRVATQSAEEYDHYTLNFALTRLDEKRDAIAGIRKEHPAFPPIKPILLVAAASTAHADSVGRWLVEEKGFESNEVLVIHSGRKTEHDIERLTAIEEPGNRIRVVVQVFILSEGWDVTNVYVIAPLRNLQSYTGARQVMGRGLRLPLGHRVDGAGMAEEANTLDILAFGQETFEAIFQQATRDFGNPATAEGGLRIERTDGTGFGAPAGLAVAEPPEDEGGGSDTREVFISETASFAVEWPLLDLIPPEPDTDVSLDRFVSSWTSRSALDIGTLTTDFVAGDAYLGWERFLVLATEQIFAEIDALSVPLHQSTIERLLVEHLHASGFSEGDVVRADPILTASLFVDAIRERYFERAPRFTATGRTTRHTIGPYRAIVPRSYRGPLGNAGLQWQKSAHYRIPVAGWTRCAHEAVHFDTRPEFIMAQRLDRMHGIRVWLRNSPAQLRVPTMAGEAEVDFVAFLHENGGDAVMLVEVKGEHLWDPSRSPARVKARDVRLWVNESNRAGGGHRYQTVVILGSDVEEVETVADLRKRNALATLA